mmetsp:Transcript_29744/g.64358  ORF Transcript_29744/g.64358 Transcript_29744/m.64358 type:complete len:205 (-) Transcript_29744:852-1466(-)
MISQLPRTATGKRSSSHRQRLWWPRNGKCPLWLVAGEPQIHPPQTAQPSFHPASPGSGAPSSRNRRSHPTAMLQMATTGPMPKLMPILTPPLQIVGDRIRGDPTWQQTETLRRLSALPRAHHLLRHTPSQVRTTAGGWLCVTKLAPSRQPLLGRSPASHSVRVAPSIRATAGPKAWWPPSLSRPAVLSLTPLLLRLQLPHDLLA